MNWILGLIPYLSLAYVSKKLSLFVFMQPKSNSTKLKVLLKVKMKFLYKDLFELIHLEFFRLIITGFLSGKYYDLIDNDYTR